MKVTATRVDSSTASTGNSEEQNQGDQFLLHPDHRLIGRKDKQQQLADRMIGLDTGGREELLGMFLTKVSVTADDTLAMKGSLMIPQTKA